MMWYQIPLAELLFVGTGELFPFEVGVFGLALAFALAVAAYRKIKVQKLTTIL